MDTAAFLARVVPPGNYLNIHVNRTPTEKPGEWRQRTFQGTDYAGAGGYAVWAASQGYDVYFCHSALNLAQTQIDKKQRQYVRAERKQPNVQRLRALVIDGDVKRDGDGKAASKVFADRRAALAWLIQFCRTTGLPLPNLAVNSGYGFHWYWLLETPLPPHEWQPLADALKSAMVAHQYPGDTAITVDSARLLRPVGCVNLKTGFPVAVELIPRLQAADYPNAQIEAALQPWIGVAQTQARAVGGTTTATVTPLGQRPAHVAAPAQNLNAVATQGIQRRDYSFARIATQCAQVGRSLAAHGSGDPYQLWYLGHLTLAHFCVDGADFVHEISNGDPRYKQAETDAYVHRIAHEVAVKGRGAPRCSSFDSYRAGICQGCPWWGRINSPFNLGIEDGDLPDNYRRVSAPARLERWVQTKDDGSGEWRRLLLGDVHGPLLHRLPIGGYSLTFTYELAHARNPVMVLGKDMSQPPPNLGRLFEQQGITLTRGLIPQMGDFVSAWIEKLRSQRAERTEVVRPFGWVRDEAGNRTGFAVAGTLYRSDGTEEQLPGGDAETNVKYRPNGTLDGWKRAAKLFETASPALQTLIAVAFAAPLIEFTVTPGTVLSFWSKESGAGKTSALRVGQAVWGNTAAVSSHRDTHNYTMKALGLTRVMPRYWDEMRLADRDDEKKFVEMVFNIPQGREKGRLRSDSTVMESGEWSTILAATGNRPLLDVIGDKTDGTDSGAARVLEFELPRHVFQRSALTDRCLRDLDVHYGHAGRIYAQWLAMNSDKVQKAVFSATDAYLHAFGKVNSERFFIAAMACLVVGAKIAKALNLFQFDVAAINKLVSDTLLLQRQVAQQYNVVSQTAGYDLEQILGQFLLDQADYRLATDRFSKQGRNQSAQVHWAPRSNETRIHIADIDQIIRINRASFYDWCRRKGLAARSIIDQMVVDWNADVQHRRPLGGGTVYGGGQVWVIDLPCAGNTYLMACLPNMARPAQPPPGPPPPQPQRIPGNQPKP